MSARIDLSSGGFCDNSIDRTRPAIMDPYMSDAQWNTFCDDIDNALKKINTALRIYSIGIGLAFCTIPIFSIFSFAMVFGGSVGFFLSFMFIFPCVIFIVSAASSRYFLSKTSEVKEELERICKKTSDQQPYLSFHVRYERHYMNSYHSRHARVHTTQYIEVSINNQNTYMEPVITVPATVVSAANFEPSAPYFDDLEAAGSKNNNTPAERLRTLEQAKHFLTKEEYQNKRAEILAEM